MNVITAAAVRDSIRRYDNGERPYPFTSPRAWYLVGTRGRVYPLKYVYALATNQRPSSFNTSDPIRVFGRLGFDLKREPKDVETESSRRVENSGKAPSVRRASPAKAPPVTVQRTMHPPIKFNSQQHKILLFLSTADGWSTRQDMYSFVGREKGYSEALGAPNGRIHTHSLESRKYVIRRGTTRLSYRITSSGQTALNLLRSTSTERFNQPAKSTIVLVQQALTVAELANAISKGLLQFPSSVTTSDSVATSRVRRGQAALRRVVLKNYRTCCAVCDVSDRKLLRASHIIPWSVRSDTQGILSNVLCLCAFHDVLFEYGYWYLTDALIPEVRRRPTSPILRSLLDQSLSFRMPIEHPPKLEYVRQHRKRHGVV
jgi:hypothetical protein